eukprot:15480548-Alexandrium_andersonii.AAC.1
MWGAPSVKSHEANELTRAPWARDPDVRRLKRGSRALPAFWRPGFEHQGRREEQGGGSAGHGHGPSAQLLPR